MEVQPLEPESRCVLSHDYWYDNIQQVFVHGDSLKSCLVVIVVPDAETVVAWCKSRGINGTFDEICANPEAAKTILEDMNAVGKKNGLFTFELVSESIYI